jgi:probable addiction module antidote protein
MKNHKNGTPFHEWAVETLQADRELGIELLRAALEGLDNPEERGGSLLCLRSVAEAYGGLGAVAAKAGISRESLYRSLSPKGNPTLKTLVAVLNTLGLRLTVTEPAKKPARAKAKKARPSRKLAA